MGWLSDIAAKLLTNIVTGLMNWWKQEKLEQKAALAETLEKERQSIRDAADRAKKEQEAVRERQAKAAAMSDDDFNAGVGRE